jgi:hypothetical protein
VVTVCAGAKRTVDHVIACPIIASYRATDFVVFAGKREIVLHIGRREPLVDRLLAGMRASGAAFVTAWNPFSRLLTRPMNHTRQALLEADLRARSLHYLSGEGRSPSGDWEPEQSVLIFKVSRREAVSLGRRWRQNAIVYVFLNRAPELVVLRCCFG